MPVLPGPDPRVLAGRRAQRLEPRARTVSGEVELELDVSTLPEDARVALEEAARRSPGHGPSGRPALRLDLERLALLGSESEDLNVLTHTARAVARAPRAPRLAGILNVTPDSFSDGGRHLNPDKAVARGREMIDQGALLIDVGAESTRPGAEPVPAAEECRRLLPVIEALRTTTDATLSVDTTKAEVAAAALNAGATMVNDVSAGCGDPDMLPLVAERGCELVLMHMLGTPRDMQADPRYDDVVADVVEHLRGRVAACLEAGIDPARLSVDPGIGFGKTLEHNLTLLARLGELRSLGLPLYVGVSRKSFIGAINTAGGRGGEAADTRLGGTAAALAACVAGGAEVLRVHDVGVMAEAARVARAILVGHVG